MHITRRAFFERIVDLAAIAAGGSLVINGKKQLKRLQEHIPENPIPVPEKFTIEDAVDVTLGGTLGFVTKKMIEKNINLKHTNETLSTVVSKLQKLEESDLPNIEGTLKEFIKKEDIAYTANSDSDLVISIRNLLDAILIHIDAHKKAAQPYLEELQKLRAALTQSLIEQLQHNSGDIAKEGIIQASRTKEFTEYISTLFINALKADGIGEQIFKDIAKSIKGKDLLSAEGLAALRKSVADASGSKPVLEAATSALSSEIIEYNIIDRIVKIYLRKLKGSLQDNDPDIVAFKNLLIKASNNALA